MRRRKDTFAQAIVGIFMVTVLLLLGYFTIVISGVEIATGKRKVRLTAVFDQVGGLKEHDNVLYRGTKVGTVEGVLVTPSNLVVSANVDPGVVLRTGARLTVCNLSMLGGNYLLAEEGTGARVDIETTVFRGETPTDWMADFSRVVRSLRDMTDRLDLDGIVTNLEAASVSARAVAARVERGEGLLGKLTTGQDALYDEAYAAVTNVKQIVARFNRRELSDELDRAIADFRSTCTNIAAASERFQSMCTNVAAAGANIATATRGVDLEASVARANAFMDEARVLSTNLNAIALKIRAGEGTLGRLTSDERLYEEVRGLIRDCRQIIDNYRDTTPITTFSSLATGAL